MKSIKTVFKKGRRSEGLKKSNLGANFIEEH
jgi:hypothetical protein